MKFVFVVLSLLMGNSWAGRPDGAFSFKDSSCVCRDDKPVSKGDCANVCKGKSTKGVDVLFADFSVSSVLANSSLKYVKNWCYKYLIGDAAFPKCVLEVTDSFGKKTILPNFSMPSNNSLTTDVSSLPDDQNYVIRLVETTSKTASLPFEIYIFDPIGIPLRQMPLTQYSCIPRAAKDLRSHFYFSEPWSPEPVSAQSGFICHDVAKYGENDSVEFPRLESAPGISTLWNQANFLFFDNNGDGVLDINELFIKKVKEYGGTTKNDLRLFGLLSSPANKEANLDAGNTAYERLGFVMSYWVDNATYDSYCPNESNYATGKAPFKAIKDLIKTSSEGIYVADRSEDEVRDYLLIRETDLKAVWFYQKNGVPTKPLESNVAFQTIYFYYPLNKATPYVKGPNQKMYRLRSAQEIGSLTTLQAFLDSTGEMISQPSHDRKIGCIPKL